MNALLPTVYLARHGETAWSVSSQHTGLTDLPLTERGERNARSLKERLSAAGNKSSSTIPSDVGLHGLIGFSSGYHAIKEIPCRVEFSGTELPKSGSGKLKRILRERSWAHQEGAVD